jgi:uncharacterized membrane protein YeaQ/YmgE (transglycosylase-associated protein family)
LAALVADKEISLRLVRRRANATNADQSKSKRMNIISLIIEAVSGAVGGNIAGAAMKDNSLGTVGNSIAGIVGGGLGGTLLQTVMGTAAAGGGSLDLSTILSNVAGGGVGGAILMAVIGLIKSAMAKKS